MTPRPDGTAEKFYSTSWFRGLDGLRGIAIFLVLFHHTHGLGDGWWETLRENGRYGVSLFFIVSGFLITTLLLREKQQTGGVRYGNFFARRALRLLPLYYAVLGLHVIAICGFHLFSPENQELFKAKLPAYLFYYSNLLPTATQGPFLIAWSLAAEEQFYVGLCLIAAFVPLRYWVHLLAGALLVKFTVYQTFGNVDTMSPMLRVLFSYQEAILWGVLLALALQHRAVFQQFASVGLHRVPGALLATLLTAWLVFHPMETQSTWDAELLYLGMTLLVGLVICSPTAAFLDHRALVHVGKISYGIYLLHTPIGAGLGLLHRQSPWMLFALTVVLSLISASIVYRWFEAPIIAYYKRRFSPRPASATPWAATAPTAPVQP